MTSNKGLRAAKIADLDAFAEGRLAVLPSRLFGASDGMASAECMLASPGAARLADGTVWFPTISGVVRVDPAHLQHNALPPPVLVESIIANGQATPADNAVPTPTIIASIRPRSSCTAARERGEEIHWLSPDATAVVPSRVIAHLAVT